MSDLHELAAALEAAGHHDAGRVVRDHAARPQQPQPQPQPAPEQPPAPDELFAAQIREAQQKSGGWQSVPIDAPVSDQTGRF